MENIAKPAWWKPAIKSTGASCLCCETTTDILSLETKLYNGFGGWNVFKNGKIFFIDPMDAEWEDCKDLNHVESLIGEDSENEYIAHFYSPLREAIYQRHAKDVWVLIEKGPGFA